MSAKTILIVDDDPDMRRGLGTRLKSNGYEVAFAGDGITAVSAALREKPDLILLDLGLPGGDGFVVMQRLGSLAPLMGVPIIVVSAREPSMNQRKSIQAGAQRYFQKPVDIDELLVAVADALGPIRSN